MQKLDETHPDSRWIAVLEREGHGDQVPAVEERKRERQERWLESVARRDAALERLRIFPESITVGERKDASVPLPAMEPLEVERLRMDSEIGRWSPEFSEHPPWRRWIAERIARLVLYLTGFIHVHQRRFNHGAVDRMVVVGQKLDQLLEEVNRLNRRLEALEGVPEVSGGGEISAAGGVADAPLPELRREIHRLQRLVLAQSVELADLQVERQSRNLRRLDTLD